MKKIICLFIFTVIAFSEISSQTLQWRLLNGSPGITGGPRSEDIYFINQYTGWIIAYSGKVERTTNGGTNWASIFSSTGLSFRSVGFFDSTTGVIGTLSNDTNKVLRRTTDGGFTWADVGNIAGKRPQGICGISIVNQNTAYACGRYFSSARVIKTTDKGITWTKVFDDTSKARTLVDCYFWTADSGIVVGGYNTTNNFNDGNAVILKTTNGGTSWNRVAKTSRTSEWCWKISFVSRNVGFVSIERESGFSYILKTTNNGSDWSEIPFMVYDEEGIGFVNENTGWVGGWTGPTYQTTNGGANWNLAGWGTYINRFRFLNDSIAYAVGDRAYKYSPSPVGIQNLSVISPNSFSLYQNIPNPFNPETIIKYDLPETGFITLKVYDVLGNEITTLVNQMNNAGSYTLHFYGNNFPNGIYFYKLMSEKFSETKRMILLK